MVDDPITTGIVSAVCLVVGAFITKVVDAIIRWRQSEDGMRRASRGELYARITHLESVVQTLQNENSRLNHELGRLQGMMAALRKEFDAEHIDGHHHGEHNP